MKDQFIQIEQPQPYFRPITMTSAVVGRAMAQGKHGRRLIESRLMAIGKRKNREAKLERERGKAVV